MRSHKCFFPRSLSPLINGQRHASRTSTAGYDLANIGPPTDFVFPFSGGRNDPLHSVQGQRLPHRKRKRSMHLMYLRSRSSSSTSDGTATLGRGDFIKTRDVALLEYEECGRLIASNNRLQGHVEMGVLIGLERRERA